VAAGQTDLLADDLRLKTDCTTRNAFIIPRSSTAALDADKIRFRSRCATAGGKATGFMPLGVKEKLLSFLIDQCPRT
jgi:hypothetical protein